MLPHGAHAYPVGRVPLPGETRAPDVGGVDLVPGADVQDVAVTLDPGSRCANRQRVANRHVDESAELLAIVTAIFGRDFTGEFMLGCGRDGVDHAPGRVATVQRALRAAQHLDPLDIVKLCGGEAIDRERDVVFVDTDAGIGRQALDLRADATNLEIVAPEAGGPEAYVRNGDLEVGSAVESPLLQGVRRKGRDGDRNILKVLRPLLRGNDDFADLGFGLRFLRDCRHCRDTEQ